MESCQRGFELGALLGIVFDYGCPIITHWNDVYLSSFSYKNEYSTVVAQKIVEYDSKSTIVLKGVAQR